MKGLLRLCRAECLKMCNTILLPLYLLVPLAGCTIFLLYYRFSGFSGRGQITGYMEVLGVVLPLLVSIICSRSAELEEGNHFQTFLGTMPHRYQVFLAKWIVLQMLELVALIVAVGLFAVGYDFLSGNVQTPVIHWFISICALWAGSILLYPFHIFINLRFSKTVSMCIGVAELLVSSLLLTGLGESIWQYVPCSWSARWCISLMGSFPNVPDGRLFQGYLQQMAVIGMLITVAVCGIILLWFRFYEGRQCND